MTNGPFLFNERYFHARMLHTTCYQVIIMVKFSKRCQYSRGCTLFAFVGDFVPIYYTQRSIVMGDLANALRDLSHTIEKSNSSFDIPSFVSAICSVISLIAIILLVIERAEKRRPYLQVSLQLLRSNLTCLVLKNVGTEPLTLHNIVFNKEFIEQLPERDDEKFDSFREIDVSIFPNCQRVICLGTTNTDIMLNFKMQTLVASYEYSKAGSKSHRHYNEHHNLSFQDYAFFLEYISDIDELKKEVRKTNDKLHLLIQEESKIASAANKMASTLHKASQTHIDQNAEKWVTEDDLLNSED